MKRHQWKITEDALLIREYRSRGPRWCADALGLRVNQVYQHAHELGLRTSVPRGRPFAHGHDARRNELNRK